MSSEQQVTYVPIPCETREHSYIIRGVSFDRPVGGMVLSYRAERSTSISLALDDPSRAEITSMRLSAACDGNKQLYPLTSVPSGMHDVYLISEDDVLITEVTFCAADAVVTGTNPVICVDMPDPDVIRVGDTYYMASTTMHNMPGCTLLRSYDLIRWEIVSYVYDLLPSTPARCLEQGRNAYGQGMWAPSLCWHKGVFHICFSANDTHCTYHYWSESITGPWQSGIIEGFYHDCSLFFDDDDRVYMVYGGRKVYITELNADLTGPEPGGLHRLLLDYGDCRMLGYEGSHLYKHEGRYILFTIHSDRTRWYREESCFSAVDLRAPFEGGVVLHDDMGYHDQGVAQGGMVDTPDGRWYAFLFQDRGASGRMPVLMPMHWERGMPVLAEDGKVSPLVCNLSTHPGHGYQPISHSDSFTTAVLSNAWQWNHHPKPEYVSVGNGALCITTDAVCGTLTAVRNVLTQRAISPVCIAEVTVSAEEMKPGDIAGIAAFQSGFAAIGLQVEDTGYSIVAFSHDTEDPPEGHIVGSIPWKEACAVFRLVMDFEDMRDLASLYVRKDGQWLCLLKDHAMRFTLDHFTGNKVALYCMANKEAGGTASFREYLLHAEES